MPHPCSTARGSRAWLHRLFSAQFFGTNKVKHATIIGRAFEEVKGALQEHQDEVQAAQVKPTGYEINCAQL